MKRIIGLVFVILLIFIAVGCDTTVPESNEQTTNESAAESGSTEETTSTVEETTSTELSSELQAIYDKLQFSKPVENTTGEQIKIAFIVLNNTSFWVDIIEGTEDVTKLMADPKFNCQVDMVTKQDWDATIFSDAVDNCITMGYNAICTVGVGDGMVPAINRAVEAGIPVYTFCTDTAMESERTAFIGQDLYEAGFTAGETLAELVDYEGEVAILTGLFSVSSHELRRQGAKDALTQYEDITIVAEVEGKDSVDESFARVTDLLTSYPDLKGIYAAASGHIGSYKAIRNAGREGDLKFISMDFMPEVIEGIYEGVCSATIGQDPWTQGACSVVMAYNEVITGEQEFTGDVYVNADVVTAENVEELFPQES